MALAGTVSGVPGAAPGGDLDLTGYVLVAAEEFDADHLDTDRWWPYYTPHWSSPAATAARYEVGGGRLRLRVEEGTAPWAPEWDGEVRVSHLQTGQVSGPVGSGRGQHRFRRGLVVREEQPEHHGWLVRDGVLEVRTTAVRHPAAMVAFWPIGVEDRPDDCGEICVAEVFGSEMDATGGLVGVGVKPQRDPRLTEDFVKVWVDGDLTAPHDYAVAWEDDELRFHVDGRLVHTVRQRMDYPVQLMLDLYELPVPGVPRDTAALPHVAEVHHVRHWRRHDRL